LRVNDSRINQGALISFLGASYKFIQELPDGNDTCAGPIAGEVLGSARNNEVRIGRLRAL